MAAITPIAGIILAAGGSTRMGEPKQMLSHQGQTLLRRAAEFAIAAKLSPVVVVLGDDPNGAMRGELEKLPVRVATNREWRLGMGTSVRAGMAALDLSGETCGVMLMLCDQPLVTGSVLGRLVDCFSQEAGLAAAAYAGIVGVPALFGREYFAQLAALADREGAKSILLKNRQRLTEVPMDEAAVDVDTPFEYAKLCESKQSP